MKIFYYLLLSAIWTTTFAENNTLLQVGFFSSGNIENWNNKIFSAKTDYQLTQLDNTQVLKAESHSSASGLFKKQQINLLKTPYLNWRWRIEQKLQNKNEQIKSGDDYSARIYVVVDGGLFFWETKAINYVWASKSPKETVWPNAFAGKNTMMIAVRSKNDQTHQWYQEKRNVLDDLKQQYGNGLHTIDAIAIMTDTDNTKSHAIAYYGDIYFSSE